MSFVPDLINATASSTVSVHNTSSDDSIWPTKGCAMTGETVTTEEMTTTETLLQESTARVTEVRNLSCLMRKAAYTL